MVQEKGSDAAPLAGIALQAPVREHNQIMQNMQYDLAANGILCLDTNLGVCGSPPDDCLCLPLTCHKLKLCASDFQCLLSYAKGHATG